MIVLPPGTTTAPDRSSTMKQMQQFGMPWEEEYGYAQAVRLGDTVCLAGQVGHDDAGQLANGMDAQMRLAYSNIKKLMEGFDMTMDDIVEEVVYVMDIDSAFSSRKQLGKEYYTNPMEIASTLIAVARLALVGQLVEIKILARKRGLPY
jgi:2-iminobutanoate/2-iminopropanoate deaminase